jgi:hypothetical protein
MATYVNNLRLKEIVTGAESGTWGTSTNTNLELIADALGSGTEAITTNADAHTTTIADGAADEGRALFLKYTGTLDSACTITLAPNTVNKVWFIENATSGSQNIIISQGSGANITIAAGKIAVILTDGAGSGAAVLDALADLELSSTLTVGGAATITGVTTHGGNVVSDTDSTDDLGTTGVRWANLWVDAITMGGTLAGAVATFSSTVGITGVTTHGDDVVSDTDSTDDLGTTGVRWANLFVDDVVATTTVKPGTLVLAAGSITDTSGAITFGNENLVTTGTFGAAATTLSSTLAVTERITASAGITLAGSGASGVGVIRFASNVLILQGGTSGFHVNNAAGSVNNISMTDAGAVTLAGTLTVSAASPALNLTSTGASNHASLTATPAGSGVFLVNSALNGMFLQVAGSTIVNVAASGVTITGALSKGSGSFKIDHPLPSKSETHHLVHSFIEGPRADLIYRGVASLSGGSATVDLDEAAGMSAGTWELLCRDPQVWIQNDSGWAQVRGSVAGSTLTISCEDAASTDSVSWMVVAERHDPHMMETGWTDDDGRVIVEPEKVEPEEVEPLDDAGV